MSPLLSRPVRSREERDRGFTLIEILVAIVLVGILAGVAVVGVGALTGSGSASACTASADAARAASTAYYAAHGAYAADFSVLTGGATPLLVAPTDATVSSGAISTSDWTLTMGFGAGGPTFTCGGGGSTGTTTASTLAIGPASTSTTPPTTIAPTTTRATTTTIAPTTTRATTTTTTTIATAVPAVPAVPDTLAPVTDVPDGIAVSGKLTGQSRYFLEWDVALTNKLPITAMTLTITVADDGAWKYHGEWANLWGGIWKASSKQGDGIIVWRFDLVEGQTIVEGNWTLAAQADGSGKDHSLKGDSWTMFVATESQKGTFSGTFG